MKKLLLSITILALGISTNAQTVANGTMESWTSLGGILSLERPNNWWGIDEVLGGDPITIATLTALGISPKKQIYKSTDKYDGDFAARIWSRKISDSLGVLPGIMSNAEMNFDFAALAGGGSLADLSSALSFSGGTALGGNKADSVNFWALAPAANLDNAGVSVTAYKYTNVGGVDTLMPIGAGAAIITPDSSGYRHFSVPVVYTDADYTATDTLRIIFTSSSLDTSMSFTDENRVFIDNVEVFTSTGTWLGMDDMEKVSLGFEIYPNPANQVLTINNAINAENCFMQIVDVNGKIMLSSLLNTGINKIDINKFASGIYYYQIINNAHTQQQVGNFVKQ